MPAEMADVEYFKSSFPKSTSGWPSPMASDWVASSLGPDARGIGYMLRVGNLSIPLVSGLLGAFLRC